MFDHGWWHTYASRWHCKERVVNVYGCTVQRASAQPISVRQWQDSGLLGQVSRQAISQTLQIVNEAVQHQLCCNRTSAEEDPTEHNCHQQ